MPALYSPQCTKGVLRSTEYPCTINALGILHRSARDTRHQNEIHQNAAKCWCASNAPKCIAPDVDIAHQNVVHVDVVVHQNARDTGAGPWCDSACDGVTPHHPLTCHTRSLSLFTNLYSAYSKKSPMTNQLGEESNKLEQPPT